MWQFKVVEEFTDWMIQLPLIFLVSMMMRLSMQILWTRCSSPICHCRSAPVGGTGGRHDEVEGNINIWIVLPGIYPIGLTLKIPIWMMTRLSTQVLWTRCSGPICLCRSPAVRGTGGRRDEVEGNTNVWRKPQNPHKTCITILIPHGHEHCIWGLYFLGSLDGWPIMLIWGSSDDR